MATIVRPMIAGSTPSDEASSEAALTNTVLPPIRQASPTIIHTADISRLIGFFSAGVSSLFFPDRASRSVMTMKMIKKANIMAASYHCIFPSNPQSRTNSTDETSAKGMSFLTVCGRILIGATRAAAPTMSRALKIFDPTTLPTAMPG